MGCASSKRTRVVSLNNGDTTSQLKSAAADDTKETTVTPQQHSAPKVTFNFDIECDVNIQVTEDDTDLRHVTLNEETKTLKNNPERSLKEEKRGAQKCGHTADMEDADDGDNSVKRSRSGRKVQAGNDLYRDPQIIEPGVRQDDNGQSPGTNQAAGV